MSEWENRTKQPHCLLESHVECVNIDSLKETSQITNLSFFLMPQSYMLFKKEH